MNTVLSTGVTTVVDAALSAVTDVGAGSSTFLPVIAARGPLTPVELSTIDTYEAVFGGRHSGHEPSFDIVDALTSGSGQNARVVVVRVVGPNAKAAKLELQDTKQAKVATIHAANPGTWGNQVKIGVANSGGTSTVTVTDAGRIVHQWAVTNVQDLADQAVGSGVVTVEIVPDKATETLKAVNETALAGGVDHNDGITLEHVRAAISQMDESYGGGQLIAPQWTTTQAHQMLIELAETTNRVALLDAPFKDNADTQTVTEWAGLRAKVGQVFVDGRDVAWRGALFPMWMHLRNYGAGAGIPRKVPGSVFAAAVIARNADRITPNEQPIETNGYAAGNIFTTPVVKMNLYTIDQTALKSGGNFAFQDYHGLRLYGFTSVSNVAAWGQFNRARFACTLAAEVSDRTRFIIGRLDNESNRTKLRDMISGCIDDHIKAGNIVPLDDGQPYRLITGSDTAQPSRITVSIEVKFAHAIQAVVISVMNRAK